jgi:hypothetical protein
MAAPAGAHRTSLTHESVAREGDRMVRWIVGTYVLGLVGGGLVALIGLAAGWW